MTFVGGLMKESYILMKQLRMEVLNIWPEMVNKIKIITFKILIVF